MLAIHKTVPQILQEIQVLPLWELTAQVESSEADTLMSAAQSRMRAVTSVLETKGSSGGYSLVLINPAFHCSVTRSVLYQAAQAINPGSSQDLFPNLVIWLFHLHTGFLVTFFDVSSQIQKGEPPERQYLQDTGGVPRGTSTGYENKFIHEMLTTTPGMFFKN